MSKKPRNNALMPAGQPASGERARPSRISRRAWLGVAAGGGVLAFGGYRWGWFAPGTADAKSTPTIVYASPTCVCCGSWMKHLDRNGFDVAKKLVDDVSPLKRKYGIPEDLWSCHTAIVDGYAVEGHVPADLIQRMLDERPAIAGLAAPGMPNGAPGMEGALRDRYEIIAFTRTGATQVYAIRG